MAASQSVIFYTDFMNTRLNAIGLKLGTDLSQVDAQSKAIITGLLAMVAVLVKQGVTNNTWTDAQLGATLDAAIAEAFPPV